MSIRNMSIVIAVAAAAGLGAGAASAAPLCFGAAKNFQFIGAGEVAFQDLSRFGLPQSLACVNPRAGRVLSTRIDTHEQYRLLGNDLWPVPACRNFQLPEIDLCEKTILGVRVSAGGCSVDFVRKVYLDELSRKIIYAVEVFSEGACEKMSESMNWIAIPKIPLGYVVETQVTVAKAK